MIKSFFAGVITAILFVVIGYWYITNYKVLDFDKLPRYSTTFDKKANPNKDLTIALKKAKKENKKIFLIVGGNWCKWCGAFDTFLDNNIKIKTKFYTKYEVVRVYYGKDIDQNTKNLLIQFPPLEATPHFYILSYDKKLLVSQKSAVFEKGFGYDKVIFEKFLDDN
jgi:thioredoxin-related protein